MERRRNRPVKYDRKLMHKTVLAMQKVEEVSMNDQAQTCNSCDEPNCTMQHCVFWAGGRGGGGACCVMLSEQHLLL